MEADKVCVTPLGDYLTREWWEITQNIAWIYFTWGAKKVGIYLQLEYVISKGCFWGSNLWASPAWPAWGLKALSWRVTRLEAMTCASMAKWVWAEIK